jgi:tRNA1Val (adenine37-N6)-methyltransferase
MSGIYFSFKQFTINQEKAAFKVGTDGVLLGAASDVVGVKKILEIGTGTGLIALMLAQRSEAEIVALEPDYESYKQACENINLSKWNSRIKVVNSDLQNYIPEAEKFNLIVTNPPYFSDSLKNPDPRKSSTRHNDSLTSVELLMGANRLIQENGKLQLILPYVEGNIFITEAVNYGFYCNSILKIRPLPDSEIRRLILTFSRKKTLPTEKFLTIEKGKRHEFTEEYINLTREFYLNF